MSLLKKTVDRFKLSQNVEKKRKLNPILQKVKQDGYKSDSVLASIGEDAAALSLRGNGETFVLLTTDAIDTKFVESSPLAAGFSAIYVGIDDIMACGGLPVAASITLGFKDPHFGDLIMEGVLNATKRFEVPLVRGHTDAESSKPCLTSTLIGYCDKDDFLSIKNAQPMDILAVTWDKEGKPGKINPNYWNTILDVDTDVFYRKRSFIRKCSREKLIHACKDIANGGVLGTVYQLVRYSGAGAVIELDGIQNIHNNKPFPYPLPEFLFNYLTSSFLITFPATNEKIVKKLIAKSKMGYFRIGHMEEGVGLCFSFGDKRVCVDEG